MKVGRKKLFMALSVVFVTAAGAILIIIFRDKPPAKEFAMARKSIAEARSLRSDIYSADLYYQSEDMYDSALVCWKKENKKFFISRDFTKVKDCILLSAELAERAKGQSLERAAELKSGLKISIDSLMNEINKFQYLFDKLPVPEPVRSDNNRGRLMLSEAIIAYEGKQYALCNEKLAVSADYISGSYIHAKELLTDYFKNYQEWQEKARQNIKYSASTNSYTILADKFSRQCFVYSKGKVKYTFGFELGKNWIGDKRYMGDKATPEGHYQVIEKKEGHQTKYYKALLLNYPNEVDRQRFSADKRNGSLLKSSEIGGLIEIHGQGGKGTDWTDGCIALMDSDMDILYKLAQRGTMVTIVGSLKPVEDILK
jgi:lipoprotein-anchoring transpeptidase ErfK/SrfK